MNLDKEKKDIDINWKINQNSINRDFKFENFKQYIQFENFCRTWQNLGSFGGSEEYSALRVPDANAHRITAQDMRATGYLPEVGHFCLGSK